VGTAIYLTEYTRENLATRVIRFGVDCLAGIPSIIFGLFGFVLFVVALGFGWSIAAGALSLAFMVLPTIIRTSEEAIRAVPQSYRECAQALGATKWQIVTRVVLPSALPGITTGLILGVGRAVSETAVVIFTAGLALRLPHGPFDSVRTMAVHFYVLAREGLSLEKAYGTAAVLLLCILALNLVAYTIVQRFSARLR
jgi:phosphate transport system permease protein